MIQTKLVANIKTHIWCSISVLRKWCRLWDNAENIRYSQTEHRWKYHTASAFFMPDN